MSEILLLVGLIFGPAIVVVLGSLAIGWLERRQDLPGRPSDTPWSHVADLDLSDELGQERSSATSLLWAVPFAALSAGLILAPVVVAVWAVAADKPAVGYLATIGFGVGALAVNQLARSGDARPGITPWTRAPGVLLSAAVGFIIALVGFLGSELTDLAGLDLGGNGRVLVPLAIAMLLGALGWAAWAQRRGRSGGSDHDV